MSEEIKTLAVEYEHGGNLYSMWIFGTQLEAETHALHLGLGTPELVVEQVTYEFELHNSLIN